MNPPSQPPAPTSAQLAQALSAEFGKGFGERNLRNMRALFLQFPIWNALRSELKAIEESAVLFK